MYQALNSSLVYFILPSEYASSPDEFEHRRIRLGGIVEAGTIDYDEHDLQLIFAVTDSIESYTVRHAGTPPELFQENIGVVVEGRFDGDTFVGDNVLIRHSEVYKAPEDGDIDLDMLREQLQ